MDNMPITRNYVKHDIHIWRPSETNLKGKSTETQTSTVILNSITIMPIPPEIIANHGQVVLGMDVVKVNKVPFLVYISRILRFGTATELRDLKMDTLVPVMIRIVGIYRSRGFEVIAVAADGGFEPMKHNE